jgi:hypothetical protein
LQRWVIGEYLEWASFRPVSLDGAKPVRHHLDRKTPWRLVEKLPGCGYPNRLGQRGIGIHSLRKTAINDAMGNGGRCTR